MNGQDLVYIYPIHHSPLFFPYSICELVHHIIRIVRLPLTYRCLSLESSLTETHLKVLVSFCSTINRSGHFALFIEKGGLIVVWVTTE